MNEQEANLILRLTLAEQSARAARENIARRITLAAQAQRPQLARISNGQVADPHGQAVAGANQARAVAGAAIADLLAQAESIRELVIKEPT